MPNLKRIADATDAEIELIDPETGSPMGVFFLMAGPEHPKRKKLDFERQRKLRQQMQKTGKIEFSDPEDDLQTSIDTLVESTLGWRGYTDDNDAEIVFSKAEASSLFNDDERGWLRAQLQTKINERERFIKRSAKT